jgi:hypothetical protein
VNGSLVSHTNLTISISTFRIKGIDTVINVIMPQGHSFLGKGASPHQCTQTTKEYAPIFVIESWNSN